MFSKKNKIIKWNWTDWKEFSIGTFFGIATATCGAVLPFLVRYIEQYYSNTPNKSVINSLIYIILIMVAIGVLAAICAFFSKIFLSKLSARKLSFIRQEMFEKIQNVSPKDLQKYDHGSLITRLTTDIYNFSLYYNWLIINVIPSLLRWIIFLIMTMFLNYLIGLILLGMSAILYLISFLISKNSVKYFEKSLNKIDRINKITQENIVGARIIKSFNLKQIQTNRFNKVNNEAQDVSAKADIKAFLSWPFAISFVNGSAIIVVLVFAQIQWSGIQFANTRIDVGTIYAIFSYSYLILWSVYDFVFLYVYDARSTISRKRIYEIQNLENTLNNTKGKEFELGDIVFNNVSFKYNNQSLDYVLHNLNFKISKNSKVGIIGPTGSGKTTLMNLISRLYEVSDGKILIHNEYIQEINTNSLISNISYAFQQKYLFAGTIRENIKIANENLSDEEIMNILKMAQFDKFVLSKKEGLDYKLEEYGQNLSGGQKQRMNIARALARDAKIYLFDDTLSALDNITEKKVLNEIFNKVKNSILIISSQKVSTIQQMDLIIVLDKGEISGMGTHNELLKNNLIYKEIFEFQTKGDKNE